MELQLGATVESGKSTGKKSCVQEGFLPVPIGSVPPDSLSGLEIYIYTPPTYNLYKSTGLNFGLKDYHRLQQAGTKYVYIETKNHQRYYDAIEDTLGDIVNSKSIAVERKCEILYATTLALTQELTSSPPNSKTIDKAEKLTANTIDLVLKNPSSFNHLFNMSNHDFYTATHTSNVSIMLIAFANKIGIKDASILNELGTGALLHDIGKIFIPQDLLNKTDKLSDQEFALIQSHVEKGVKHLESSNIKISDIAMKLVAEHHEKLNGRGYPNNLIQEAISIYGRMITVVDMFEAMTSVRPYRDSAMPIEKAINIIQEMVPEQLDEKIVNSFSNFIDINLKHQTGQPCEDDVLILNALGIKPETDDLPHGRRHKRFHFRTKCSIKSIKKENGKIKYGDEQPIIAHDISQSGIGLLSGYKYSKGQYICVTITIAELNKSVTYVAEIKRVIDHTDGWFTIGAEFLKEQSSDHIEEIFSSLK